MPSRAASLIAASFVFALGALCAPAAQAQSHRHDGYGDGGHWRFDDRYHHDHYYPAPGLVMPILPGGSISVGFGGIDFFFRGGVWFRPAPRGFVVVTPPLGIVAPVAPPACALVWIGRRPYCYADGVYYAGVPGGYQVVAPPPGADTAQVAPPAPPEPASAPDPIVYPRNGQSDAQTEADRRACDRWATTQPNAMSDARIFQRAVEACLDGRGYTVR